MQIYYNCSAADGKSQCPFTILFIECSTSCITCPSQCIKELEPMGVFSGPERVRQPVPHEKSRCSASPKNPICYLEFLKILFLLLGSATCFALAGVTVFFCFERDLKDEHQIAAVLLLGLPLLVLCFWFIYKFCLGVLGVIAAGKTSSTGGRVGEQQT